MGYSSWAGYRLAIPAKMIGRPAFISLIVPTIETPSSGALAPCTSTKYNQATKKADCVPSSSYIASYIVCVYSVRMYSRRKKGGKAEGGSSETFFNMS